MPIITHIAGRRNTSGGQRPGQWGSDRVIGLSVIRPCVASGRVLRTGHPAAGVGHDFGELENDLDLWVWQGLPLTALCRALEAAGTCGGFADREAVPSGRR
jgi:hypothetical protein